MKSAIAMEPRIQYARTGDGVSVAYWTLGSGEPLIEMAPLPFTHVRLEWAMPEIRRWYERLAQRRTLIRYDGRGLGLSDRDARDFSLDAMLLDLEAVADRVAPNTFALLGCVNSGPAAIAYGVRNPGRVSHLILWCSYARATLFLDGPEAKALRGLVETDWRTFVQTVAHSREGWSQGEAAARFVRLVQEAVTPQTQAEFMDTMRLVDVSELLPSVTTPTLILHRPDSTQLPQAAARELAAGIPDARLVLLEGAALAPYLGNTDEVLTAVFEFLGESSVLKPDAPPRSIFPSGTAVILFADIADSTALTERLGDNAFREKARGLDGALRAVIRETAGTPIEGKLLGDGVLAVFTSARQAIEAALRCATAGTEASLPLHLGLHAGDVIREENNVYGGAVNIASRIRGSRRRARCWCRRRCARWPGLPRVCGSRTAGSSR